MTPDIPAFKRADAIVRNWITRRNKPVPRIMGGAHPTFFPEVCDEMQLDAIVVGEGDNAMVRLLKAHEENEGFDGIPNVFPAGGSMEGVDLELIDDLDEIPFLDRDVFYDAVPHFRNFRLRSVKIGRGCPYRCTYCHNHVFNALFRKSGKIVRRRSVDSVMNELKHVVTNCGPVGQIRFGDDTFIYKIDDWVREFLRRYKEEINLPFYCLLRSNVITDEMVELLADAGCCSVSLSVESGREDVRNNILKRGISDEKARQSFATLRKYGIKTQTNSMLGLPGGTIEDDLLSFRFEKSLKPSVGQFSIWTPFPRTKLTDIANDGGCIPDDYNFENFLWSRSPLNSYSDKDKDIQLNLVHLGPLFCDLPEAFNPILEKILRAKPNKVFHVLGTSYTLFKYYISIFFSSIPKNPFTMARFLFGSLKYMVWSKE